MLKRIDDLVGYIIDKLQSKRLTDCVNLIILADHGLFLSLLQINQFLINPDTVLSAT